MMVDVLLIVPPHARLVGFNTYPNAPLGLQYIAGYLRTRGITSAICYLDNTPRTLRSRVRSLFRQQVTQSARNIRRYTERVCNPDDAIWQDAVSAVRHWRPRIVGITATVITLPSALMVARAIKETQPHVKVVIGGAAATTQPERVQASPYVDFVVTYEGEEAMYRIARHVIFGEALEVNVEPFTDLDALPFPERGKVFTIDRRGNPVPLDIPDLMIISRGCPYHCKFCAANAMWGTQPRYRSIQNIIAEMEQMHHRQGQTEFTFIDDLFTASEKRVLEFCKALVDSGMPVTWKCCARLSNLSARMLAAMNDAGCTGISVGIESGSDRVLRYMGKGLAVDVIRAKARLINASGIPWLAFIIVGVPTETEEEIEASLTLIGEIRPTRVQISAFSPYPGTEFFDMLSAQGKIQDARFNDIMAVENNYSAVPPDRWPTVAHRALAFADWYNTVNAQPLRHDTGRPLRDAAAYHTRRAIHYAMRGIR